MADNQQGWDMNCVGVYQRRRSARAKPHNAQGELMITLGGGCQSPSEVWLYLVRFRYRRYKHTKIRTT
jgi:hypothetical protein